MCGIIGAFNTVIKDKKHYIDLGSVNKDVINIYQDQFKRGQEGFGLIRIDAKQKVEVDRSCEPVKFLLDLYTKESPMIIAHHRFPTSTENKISQTHPLFISNPILKFDYLLVHNGVISNTEEMKTEHEKLGFIYGTIGPKWSTVYKYDVMSFNDSESLAIEMALFIENKIPALRTRGSASMIILQVNKETAKAERVFFGHESTPLMMSKTRGKLRLSSLGEGSNVKENKLYSFDIKDKKMDMSSVPFKMATIISPYPVSRTEYTGGTNITHEHDFKSSAEETDTDYAMVETKENKIFKEEVKGKTDIEVQDLLEGALESKKALIDERITEFFSSIMEGYIENGTQGNPEDLIDDITEDIIEARNLAVIAHSEIALFEANQGNVPTAKEIHDDAATAPISRKELIHTMDDFEAHHSGGFHGRPFGYHLG